MPVTGARSRGRVGPASRPRIRPCRAKHAVQLRPRSWLRRTCRRSRAGSRPSIRRQTRAVAEWARPAPAPGTRRSRRREIGGDSPSFDQLAHRVAGAHAAHVGHRSRQGVDDHVDHRGAAASRSAGDGDSRSRRARDEHRRRRIDRSAECPGSAASASAIRLKIGAATTPPTLPPACGASIITMIATAGSRDGRKPTNETLFSDAE